jgi:protocatechuate 3,4-dioxygenase beta subunit
MRFSSRLSLIAALCVGAAPCTLAAEKAITYNLRTRIGEGEPVDRQYVVPFGSSLRAPAAGSLSYGMEVADAGDGRAFVSLSLLDAMGNPMPRTTNGGRFLRLSAGDERTISYTVCDDRVIQQESRPTVAARCEDLPRMANADPRPDGCIECLGAYEGMPDELSSHASMVPAGVAGEPLVVTGQVRTLNGAPRAGVIVYAFQTDSTGVYPTPNPPRSQLSQLHGRLRAWARTDGEGRFTLDTIEPGTYPDRSEPRHIHMVVIEPGCASYFIEDIHFADDPLMRTIDETHRQHLLTGVGGSGVVTRRKDAATGRTTVTRDIHLGEKFAAYPNCGAD